MKAKSEPWMLILLVIVGSLIGSLLWSLATPYLPEIFAKSIAVGTKSAPFVLELGVLTMTLGLVLDVNIGSVLGIVAAFLVYRKL